MTKAHIVEEITLRGPLASYRSAFERKDSFLLDGDRVCTHTLFGAEPFLTLRAWRTHRTASGKMAARVVIRRGDTVTACEVDDPLEVVRDLLAAHAIDPSIYGSRPLPFLAGAVGYVGYEMGQTLERLPCARRQSAGMPDLALSFHDWVIGTANGKTYVSAVGRDEDAARWLASAVKERLELHAPSRRAPAPVSRRADDVLALVHALGARQHVARDEYLARVAAAKDHIAAGDAFEVCLTHAIDVPFRGDPALLFDTLRAINPAPYAALLQLPEGAIVSSSPERFLALDEHGIVESRPIKGTRPRGKTPDDDDRLANELATSEKDRAENAMIVDLVRNDLGRVCRFGSVTVPELYAVERYATVHQLVSTIRGELEPEHDAVDLLRACFPPGSMTGAPKIEAMTILEELEPVERGPYAGALGWIDFSGTLDLSVVIRTIVVRDGRARIHAGGAIVADSDPASEHEETLHKARALVAALSEVTPG